MLLREKPWIHCSSAQYVGKISETVNGDSAYEQLLYKSELYLAWNLFKVSWVHFWKHLLFFSVKIRARKLFSKKPQAPPPEYQMDRA